VSAAVASPEGAVAVPARRRPPRGAAAGSPVFVEHDPAFAEVLGDDPRLVRVVATDAHEGPVYVRDEDALYFTTVPRRGRRASGSVPRVAIKRVALDGLRFRLAPERVTVVRADANAANGMTLGSDGRLLVCEQGTRLEPARISAFDPRTGEVETVVGGFGCRPLNSPNDVVARSDGTIWFTDPTYGHLQGFRPAPALGEHVYRFDPATGVLTVVASTFDKPNGIAFSPDERTLYVGDSGAIHGPGDYDAARPRRVLSFGVGRGGAVGAPTAFAGAIPGFPDGITTDADGRVYVSGAGGVLVHSPSGRLLGEIRLPGAVNFTFGGPDRTVLFITADTAVWAAVLAAKGA